MQDGGQIRQVNASGVQCPRWPLGTIDPVDRADTRSKRRVKSEAQEQKDNDGSHGEGGRRSLLRSEHLTELPPAEAGRGRVLPFQSRHVLRLALFGSGRCSVRLLSQVLTIFPALLATGLTLLMASKDIDACRNRKDDGCKQGQAANWQRHAQLSPLFREHSLRLWRTEMPLAYTRMAQG